MISLIVAYAKNRIMGNEGKIPWKIKGEQKRFRELTTGNVVIMGRRSYEEIGKPLPNRVTIVVSNTKNFDMENCYTVGSLQEAIELAGDRVGMSIFQEERVCTRKHFLLLKRCILRKLMQRLREILFFLNLTRRCL